MLHKALKTMSIYYLLFFIFLSKNVSFYTSCAAIGYENRYGTDDSETNDEDNQNNHKNETTIISTLSPQQEADLKIFTQNLEQQLLLDNKSNFPYSNNITFPPDEYKVEDLFRIITQSNSTNNGSGNYYSSFDTGNYGGVKTGELKEENIQVIKGHYTEKFKQNLPGGLSPIDVIRNVGYIADEKGYQPFIINYTFDDHRSDTEPHYDVPFYDDVRRTPKEYKAHYKPNEQFSNVQLPIITKKQLVNKDQSAYYNFSFNTQTYGRAESGETINQNTENETIIVKGQYTNVIGNQYDFFVTQTIGYIADENGFQPFLIGFNSSDGVPLPLYSTIHHYNSVRLAEDVSIHFKPSEDYKDVKLPTLNNQQPNNSSEGYQFSFNSDSYNRSEYSEIKNKGEENESFVIKGQYRERIKNERGETLIRHIGYVADERGYQPFIIKSYFENEKPVGMTGIRGTVQNLPPPGSPRGKGIGSSYIGNALGHLG